VGVLAEYRLPALRLLWWAAWAEFLFVRLLSRVGIYIPKNGAALTLYRGALTVGEIAFNLSLLAGVGVLLLVLVPAGAGGHGQGLGRARALVVGATLALVLLIPATAPASWSLAAAVALPVTILALLAQALRCEADPWQRTALLAVGAAQVMGLGVTAAQLVWALAQLPGTVPLAGELLRWGELVALLAPVALSASLVLAREPGARLRLGPVGAGVGAVSAFGVAYWANADLTAILAMYSLGFSLQWPPALYLLGLGLGVVTLLHRVRSDPSRGLALGLLLLAGYSLQVNQQHIVVLAGWCLLALPCAHRGEATAP